jgi:hypothetical protein
MGGPLAHPASKTMDKINVKNFMGKDNTAEN